MRQHIAPGLALVLLATAAPAAAQSNVGRPAGTPSAQGAVAPGTPLVTMEQSIAQQYAKLIQDARSNRAELEGKIEELEKKIQALKEQASRIQLIAEKTEQVLPKILASVGPSSGGRGSAPSARRLEDLGALLGAELSKAGVRASAAELRWVVEAIGRGGPGAGSRVSAQAAERIERTQVAIHSTRQEIEQLRAQVEDIDQEITQLQKQRDKALADLKKQQQRAIEDARKRRETTAAPIR